MNDQEKNLVQIVDGDMLEKLSRSEIEAQVATARKYPRDLQRFAANSRMLALSSKDVAASCFYRLPRDGKVIEGPSVRLAEIVASTYGNLRCASRVVEVGDKFVVAEGVAHDLESNTGMLSSVMRGITTKGGRRYSDTMISTTGNAACSIALRNAVFRVVPRAAVDTLMEECKALAVGEAVNGDLAKLFQQAVAALAKFGATEERLLKLLRKKSAADFTREDYLTLRGLFTGIAEGEINFTDVLGDDNGKPGPSRRAAPPPDIQGPPRAESPPVNEPEKTEIEQQLEASMRCELCGQASGHVPGCPEAIEGDRE